MAAQQVQTIEVYNEKSVFERLPPDQYRIHIRKHNTQGLYRACVNSHNTVKQYCTQILKGVRSIQQPVYINTETDVLVTLNGVFEMLRQILDGQDSKCTFRGVRNIALSESVFDAVEALRASVTLVDLKNIYIIQPHRLSYSGSQDNLRRIQYVPVSSTSSKFVLPGRARHLWERCIRTDTRWGQQLIFTNTVDPSSRVGRGAPYATSHPAQSVLNHHAVKNFKMPAIDVLDIQELRDKFA